VDEIIPKKTPEMIWQDLELYHYEDYVALSALDPIVALIGDGLKATTDSRKNLRRAITELNIVASFVFLIVPTLIYGTSPSKPFKEKAGFFARTD
jgi:hypothetical protein